MAGTNVLKLAMQAIALTGGDRGGERIAIQAIEHGLRLG